MKKLLLLILILALGASPATAATKKVTVKKIEIISTSNELDGLLVSGKTLVTYSNTGTAQSNISLMGLDPGGQVLWQREIESGVDEIAMAGAVDSTGNIWIAGSSAPIVATETSTAAISAENPDGVTVEPIPDFRGDMNLLTLWKISPNGDLLATYTSAQSAPALINSISLNSTGISIVGELLERPFIVSASTSGEFGPVAYIGSSKTELNAVVRNSNGTISVFGSSSEKLGGKKLVGKRDGVLIQVSKAGKLTSVVRSSANKADRSWIASDSTLALTGYVKTGTVVQSAFTKFSSKFVPQWTQRFTSSGASSILTAGSSTYAAFGSTSSITGISGWKPPTTQLLILSISNKGVISSAFGSSDLANPISLAYSKEIGLYGLALTSDQKVTIFHITGK